MVGYATQLGWLPLSVASIEQAIRLNGVSVDQSLRTFAWGRVAAADPKTAESAAVQVAGLDLEPEKISTTLDEVIARRIELLTKYQDADYAKRYTDFVSKVRTAESKIAGTTALTEAVARNLAKLMAYKDEYEVARLHTETAAQARLKAQFDGNYKLKVQLSPPLLARKDPLTGRPKKMEFGEWVFSAFNVLKKFKGLRGTPLDIFGYTHERRTERKLIADYQATIDRMLEKLTSDNLPLAVEIANVPDEIRGYGFIKDRNLEVAKKREAALLENYFNPQAATKLAAE
jgi:indolepyruvate ferredoxin oxidoreductase